MKHCSTANIPKQELKCSNVPFSSNEAKPLYTKSNKQRERLPISTLLPRIFPEKRSKYAKICRTSISIRYSTLLKISEKHCTKHSQQYHWLSLLKLSKSQHIKNQKPAQTRSCSKSEEPNKRVIRLRSSAQVSNLRKALYKKKKKKIQSTSKCAKKYKMISILFPLYSNTYDDSDDSFAYWTAYQIILQAGRRRREIKNTRNKNKNKFCRYHLTTKSVIT